MLRRLFLPLLGLALLVPLAHVVLAESRPVEATPSGRVVGAAHNDTSTPFNLVSMPALIRHRYDGRAFRLGRVVGRDLATIRRRVAYRSGKLRITGELSIPRREGRFPLIVIAHGWHRPAAYRGAASLRREISFLTARGYVVLHPDYRNYGGSTQEPRRAVRRPRGYPEDVLNAIRAVRRARLPFVNASRVGVLGRSMGGGVALQAAAARPGMVDAVVLYSPLSSSAADNYRRWVKGTGKLDRLVRATYGRPVKTPRFWRRASVRNYVGRIEAPVQMHHGTADEVCPPRWSRKTVAALRRAGQTVEYHTYAGEGHRFDGAWPLFADRMGDFFDAHV